MRDYYVFFLRFVGKRGSFFVFLIGLGWWRGRFFVVIVLEREGALEFRLCSVFVVWCRRRSVLRFCRISRG